MGGIHRSSAPMGGTPGPLAGPRSSLTTKSNPTKPSKEHALTRPLCLFLRKEGEVTINSQRNHNNWDDDPNDNIDIDDGERRNTSCSGRTRPVRALAGARTTGAGHHDAGAPVPAVLKTAGEQGGAVSAAKLRRYGGATASVPDLPGAASLTCTGLQNQRVWASFSPPLYP